MFRYTIGRQKVDGSKKETVVDRGVNNCEGMAIDWMGRNLYWTDESLNSINVMSLNNNSYRRTILQHSFFHPRAIVLEPKKGWVMWFIISSQSVGSKLNYILRLPDCCLLLLTQLNMNLVYPCITIVILVPYIL